MAIKTKGNGFSDSSNTISVAYGTSANTAVQGNQTIFTLNGGAKNSGSSASFYAPTSAGTANQILVSAGDTSAPTWKATASGAAYATSANGALTFGTLPIAQGGTNATTAADARANLNAATGNARIFYGICGTEAGETLKEVVCAEHDGNLINGDMLIVKFDNTNTGAVGSLQLTIKQSSESDTGTAAKNIKRQYNSTGANNLVAAAELNKDSISVFIYNGTYWILTNADYNNTYSMDQVVSAGGANRTAETAANGGIGLHGYTLQMMTKNLTWSSIACTSGSTAKNSGTTTAKVPSTASFLIDTPIIYMSNNSYTAPGSSANVNGYTAIACDFRYNTSTGQTQSQTLTIQKPVYLVGTLNTDGTFKIATSNWWTQTLPASDDGKIYIFLGLAYSASNIYLHAYHPIYWFKDGVLQLYTLPGVSSKGAATSSFITRILGTTDATSTTGALIVDGGLLVNKKLYVKQPTTLASTLSVSGNSTFSGKVFSGTSNYGATLPTSGQTGQIFFQTNDNTYELPLEGNAGQFLIKHTDNARDVVWGNTISSLIVTGTIVAHGNITAPRVFNAVWNDYAECRNSWIEEPGRVIVESKSGTMELATKHLMPACKVISDTYGTLMGKSNQAKTPIAVAGRVLVYPYQPREKYNLGDAVCSAPNGTVDIMSRDEIRNYPERIIGTVSEIPNYDIWHAGTENNPIDIQVNGRIWIYVR